MASWFYLRAGKKCGPVGSVELGWLARSGKLLPTDSIWKDGLPDWVPASEVQGLFDFVPQVVQVDSGAKEQVNETENSTLAPHAAEIRPNAERPVNATSSGVLVRSTFSKINPGHLLIAVSLFASAFIVVAYHIVVETKKSHEIHAATVASWERFIRDAKHREPLVELSYFRRMGGGAETNCVFLWGTCSLVQADSGSVGRVYLSIFYFDDYDDSEGRVLDNVASSRVGYILDFILVGDDWVYSKGTVDNAINGSNEVEYSVLDGDAYLLFGAGSTH